MPPRSAPAIRKRRPRPSALAFELGFGFGPAQGPGPARLPGKARQAIPYVSSARASDNRVEYELLADRAESVARWAARASSFASARITFHDKNGTTLDASAPEAVYDQALNTLTLQGGARAHAQNGMALQCDDSQYDHAGQMLHGRGHVAITDPKGFRGTGNSFDSDISLTHYRMQ